MPPVDQASYEHSLGLTHEDVLISLAITPVVGSTSSRRGPFSVSSDKNHSIPKCDGVKTPCCLKTENEG